MLNLNLIDLLHLFPLIIIGLISSYTDIKHNKIFNRLILGGFTYIFCLYFFLFFWSQENYFSLPAIINGLTALLIGFLLWNLKLWSAGDAKLFTIFALLVPLHFYSKNYISYFPAFNLLVNLFIPLLFFLLLNAIFITTKNWRRAENIFLKIKKINILKLLFFIFKMFADYLLVITLVRPLFSLRTSLEGWASVIFNNPFILFALLFLMISLLNKLKQKNKILRQFLNIALIAYAIFLLVDGQLAHLKSLIKTALVFMIVIGLLRQMLNFYIQEKQSKKIKIKNVEEGMIPTKKDVDNLFRTKRFYIKNRDASGLTQKQVEVIKDFFKDEPDLEIRIYQSFPFAPFLLLATIISIISRTSLLPLLDMIFQSLL
jgi:Flp pilus assembly protein protease CpaA